MLASFGAAKNKFAHKARNVQIMVCTEPILAAEHVSCHGVWMLRHGIWRATVLMAKISATSDSPPSHLIKQRT